MSGAPPVLAVDLGGTRLRAAIVSSGEMGPILDLPHGGSREQPLAIDRLIGWLQPLVEQGIPRAVGVSLAGTVDPVSGAAIIADNLGWRDAPLGAALATAFGLPVWIDTDTFCGAAAEAHFGLGGRGAVLSIAIGTGIGHAWIFDGRVWRGGSDAATMFGHLIVEPEGRPCYCGVRGCLCQYAAGPALSAANDAAQETATAALARGIASALTLINPDLVVLGGGAVSDAWPDLPELTARVADHLHPAVRPVVIRRSPLGGRANLLGAGLLAAQRHVTADGRRPVASEALRTDSGSLRGRRTS